MRQKRVEPHNKYIEPSKNGFTVDCDCDKFTEEEETYLKAYEAWLAHIKKVM